MVAGFTYVQTDEIVEAPHVTQYADEWTGSSAALGVPLNVVKVNDDDTPAASFRNLGAGGRAILATSSDGLTTLLDVQDSGVTAHNLGLSGSLSFGDGAAGTPSITNTGDTNTGLYFPAADQIAVSVAGTQQMLIQADQVTLASALSVPGILTVGSGTVSAPGLIFTGDTNTGFYHPNGDEIGLSIAGARQWLATNEGVQAKLMRPMFGAGILVTPEYFFVKLTGLPLSTIVPGISDETWWVQAAIDYCKANGGGTVLFEPRPYKLGPLNLTNRFNTSGYFNATTGAWDWDGATKGSAVVSNGNAVAGVCLKGTRAQSTDNSTSALSPYWGTTLIFDATLLNTGDATKQIAMQTRACIDATGNTYGAIEDMHIRSMTYQNATGASTRPNVGILVAGVTNDIAEGREVTGFKIKNVLVVGHFTSAAVVWYASSFHEVSYSQFYNYYHSSATPTGEQGTAYAGILTGRNFVNPDCPGDTLHNGTSAPVNDQDERRYVAYSNYSRVNIAADPTAGPGGSHGHGADQGHFLACQFHDFARTGQTAGTHSTGAALRLHSVRYQTFDQGDMTSSNRCIEINDQASDSSSAITFRNFWLHAVNGALDNGPVGDIDNSFGVYLKSATTMYGLTLQDIAFEAADAAIGSVGTATACFDGLRVINPMFRRFPQVTHIDPSNGLIHLSNSTNSTTRIKNSHIEGQVTAHGGSYGLTNVGTIDKLTILKDVGAISHGGTGNVNNALALTASGTVFNGTARLPNNVALSVTEAGGTVRTAILMDASNVLTIGTTGDVTTIVGQQVNLGTGAGGGIAVLANGDTRVGLGLLSTAASAGFAYVPTCAGAFTGSPTGISGYVPGVVDTVNHRLYLPHGGTQYYVQLTS